MKKKTLKGIIDEVLDPQTATKLEPMIMKMTKRAMEDKSPESQLWQTLQQEITAAKAAQKQQQQQPNIQQPAQVPSTTQTAQTSTATSTAQ